MRAKSDHGSEDRASGSPLAAYTILALGSALVMAAHWPGRINGDSRGILRGVRGDLPIVDHWTATLTWAWQKGYEVVGLGTGGILFLQTIALFAGVYLILRACLSRTAAAVLTVLVVFAPPAFGFVVLVGRDAWFTSTSLLGIGFAVAAARWESPWARGGAVVAGVAAASVAITARQNGFTAIAAVLVGLAAAALAVLRGSGRAPWLTRRPIASATALGLTVTLSVVALAGLSDRVVRERALHPEVVTYLYDLGYLTLHEDRQLIPSMAYTAVLAQTPSEVRERWRPWTAIYMRADPESAQGRSRTRPVLTDEEVDLVGRAWREAVSDEPGRYLLGRLGLWRRQIGLGYTPLYARAPESDRAAYGYERPTFPALSTAATDYAQLWGSRDEATTTGGVIHHAWVYLLICAIGLMLALPRFPFPVRIVAALPAAGIGLQVGLFFTAPSVHWRYQLLTVYAAMLLIVIATKMAIDARSGTRHLEAERP